ncbi:MAG: hypothetical protein BGP06_06480 [Rhizobiales bacterium 65-9]|nr:MAG: hypothetical protein BGP06_06480 [Rhizobiales bacterium 65-9]
MAALARAHAGIVLGESKRNLIYSRLSRRLRALGLTAFRDYRRRLDTDATEIERFINAVSTNHTKFFREPHHFAHLRDHVARPFAAGAPADHRRRLTIWSAGCSTGEEPYSIALTLRREALARGSARILATDIDTDVLGRAMQGEYALQTVGDCDPDFRDCFRSCDADPASGVLTIDDDTREMATFRRLNLLAEWPFRSLFDVIFCRNVMIYFDGATKAALIDRFARQIAPGGWLYIGHSEALVGGHRLLEPVGRTIYRRVA